MATAKQLAALKLGREKLAKKRGRKTAKRAPAKRMKNPVAKKAAKRKSVTKKPTARRKKNMVSGHFPNPANKYLVFLSAVDSKGNSVGKKYYIISEVDSMGRWETNKSEALRFTEKRAILVVSTRGKRALNNVGPGWGCFIDSVK